MAATDPLLHVVAAAQEGDDAAVRVLVDTTQPVVWRLCHALGSGTDVDDLVQETYLRALRALPRFRGEAPFQAWLLAIGRRVCADAVRQRQRQRRLHDRLRRHATDSVHLSAEPHGLDSLLAQLTDDRREAFALTQIVGLSYEEAAEVVGCPIGTIRSRVARARAELFDALAEAQAQ